MYLTTNGADTLVDFKKTQTKSLFLEQTPPTLRRRFLSMQGEGGAGNERMLKVKKKVEKNPWEGLEALR